MNKNKIGQINKKILQWINFSRSIFNEKLIIMMVWDWVFHETGNNVPYTHLYFILL